MGPTVTAPKTTSDDIKGGYIWLPRRISLGVLVTLLGLVAAGATWAANVHGKVEKVDPLAREVRRIERVVCVMCDDPRCTKICEGSE